VLSIFVWSGLWTRSSTAGHDEIRNDDRLINFTRPKARCVRRSDRHWVVALGVIALLSTLPLQSGTMQSKTVNTYVIEIAL
jgi:hypothetical protein